MADSLGRARHASHEMPRDGGGELHLHCYGKLLRTENPTPSSPVFLAPDPPIHPPIAYHGIDSATLCVNVV